MPQETSDVPEYRSFQEFLDRHPNPSRDAGEDLTQDDPMFGDKLARRFLQELKIHVTNTAADAT